MAKLNLKKVRVEMKLTPNSMTLLAHNLGVARRSLYAFFDKYPELKEEMEIERNKEIDRVEHRLYSIALVGDAKDTSTFNSIKLILGKNRGYSDKVESKTEHKGDGFKLIIENPK